MLVSIIIPIKNGGKLFEHVMDGILSQEVSFEFEVLLIDSGSSDGTLEYSQALSKQHRNVRLYVIQPEEFGHGKTRNYGAALASGDFLVFITQDALPYNASWLQNLIEAFKHDDEIVAVFGKHLPYKSALPVERFTIKNHFDNYIGDAWQKIKIQSEEHFEEHMAWYIFFSNNNSAIRRDVFLEIGFSEVEMSEDQNFAKEILMKGYAKAYANDAIVYHSHRYSIKNIFKRCFDEYRSYFLLGVEKPASIFNFLRFYMRQYTYSLFAIRQEAQGFPSKLYWALFYITYDFAKALGYYLGTNSNKFNIYAQFSMQEENKRK